MRPLGASVVILVTAALRSLKLAFQVASGERANFKKPTLPLLIEGHLSILTLREKFEFIVSVKLNVFATIRERGRFEMPKIDSS